MKTRSTLRNIMLGAPSELVYHGMRLGSFSIFQQCLETAVNSRVAATMSDALFLKLSDTDCRAIS